MQRALWGVLGVLLLCAVVPAWAQESDQCHNIRINAKGSSGAAITVSTTPVQIVEANTSRCTTTWINENSNPYRCAPTTGRYPLAVSTTVGMYVPSSVHPVLGTAAQQAWSCVRTGAADAVLNVLEELP